MNETHAQHAGHLLIGGKCIRDGGRAARTVLNPATGESVGSVTLASPEDVDTAAELAHQGFLEWRAVTPLRRGQILSAVAARLRERSDMLARLLTLEQGKTLKEATGEVLGSADLFDWLAEEGKRLYGRIVAARSVGMEQQVLHEPVGPVAAFSPWNYPLNLACRKIAHALAAGCSIVIKPAEEAPSAVLAMAHICLECGVPPNALQVLFGVPAEVSERLIRSPRIRKVSFTGSVPVGKHLAAMAGAELKKMTMELGGHSPVIVMEDADIERFLVLAVAGKFRNAGQICISPTRFFVHESIQGEVVRRFAERAAALRVGSGLDPETEMGPLAHDRRPQAMEAVVDEAVSTGARLLAGGQRKGDAGFFWAPTVLADVASGARLMTEEPFGPIAAFSPFSDLDEVLQRANALPYGLAGYAFTSSLSHAHRIKHGLQVGALGINTFGVTAPEMPFVGIKDSGVGAAMGIEGLLDHMNIKSVFQDCTS